MKKNYEDKFIEDLLGPAPRYRVEWRHNGQWRMDESSIEFATLTLAKAYEVKMKKDSSGDLETRIVEVNS